MVNLLLILCSLAFSKSDFSVSYSDLSNTYFMAENFYLFAKELKIEPSDEDKAQFDLIEHLKNKYQGEALPLFEKQIFPLSLAKSSIDLITEAVLSADTIPKVGKNLSKFTTAEERKQFAAALNHFKTRFASELKESELLKGKAKDFDKFLDKEKIKTTLKKLYSFMLGKSKGSGAIEMIVVYSPVKEGVSFESRGRFLLVKMNPIVGTGSLSVTETLTKLITHTISAIPTNLKENLSKIFFASCLTPPTVTPESLFQIPFAISWGVLFHKEQVDKKNFDPYMITSKDPWITFMSRELYFIGSDVLKKRESIESTFLAKAGGLCFLAKGISELY